MNASLRALQKRGSVAAAVPSAVTSDTPLGALLQRMPGVPHNVADALDALDRPAAEVDDASLRAMGQPYRWFLDLVGDDGLGLTQAGYLRPAHVEAAANVLHLEDYWIGRNNREIHTYPVTQFRESVAGLGFVRKVRNRLTLTKTGRRVRGDDEAIWRHIAASLPLRVRGSNAPASEDAGLLLLLAIAAGLTESPALELVAEGLDVIGWRVSTGLPLIRRNIRDLVAPTFVVLEVLGAVSRAIVPLGAVEPAISPAGIALARAALS